MSIVIHIMFLLTILSLFTLTIGILAKIEARSRYAVGRPELNTAQNGIAFMRTKRSEKLFWYARICIFMFVLIAKLFSIYYDRNFSTEKLIMSIFILFVPVCFFLYFHPYFYFREYNRMLNKDQEKPTIFDVNATVVYFGLHYTKKLQNNALFTGIGIVILQIILTFRLHG